MLAITPHPQYFAEELGFEPRRPTTDLTVFKTALLNQLEYSSYNKINLHSMCIKHGQIFTVSSYLTPVAWPSIAGIPNVPSNPFRTP